MSEPIQTDPNHRAVKDVFISHAEEDKESVAIPLRDFLVERGFTVWLDRYEIKAGDLLSGSIQKGLDDAQFGVVILSQSFFAVHKEWPQRELETLLAQEHPPERVLLPVWHGIDKEFLRGKFAKLAEKASANTANGIEQAGAQLLDAIYFHRGTPVPTFVRLDEAGNFDPAALHLWFRKISSGNSRIQLIWPDRVRLGKLQLEACAQSLLPGTGNPREYVRVASTGCFLNNIEAGMLVDSSRDLNRMIGRAESRLPRIVEGLRHYAEDWFSIHERTIKMFLHLTYNLVWRHVAYRLAMIEGKGIDPLEYVDEIKAATNDRREYIRARLSGLSPVLCDSTSFGDPLPQCYIWVPKALWLDVVDGRDWDIFLDTFLAPQLEMCLALHGSTSVIRYTTSPKAWSFNKFKDETGEEISMPWLR